jgi:hypothetical protein
MLATQPRLRSTRQGTDVGRGVGVEPIQVPVETCMYTKWKTNKCISKNMYPVLKVYVYKMENKQMYFKKYVPGIKK